MARRLCGADACWDLIVVGGGATGVGVALDAASRGHKVVLFEQSDFGKGTSSRSTKLIHGGVRYLQQGNVPLVMEALRERGILRKNAPHHVRDLPFVVPNYRWWQAPFYGVGMRVYDALAGKYGFGPSKNLSLEETVERIPTIETEGLKGGVVYYDGQFDDARLLIHLAMTAALHGAVVLNYAKVRGFTRDDGGYLDGVRVRDEESGDEFHVRGRVVINATGVFTDEVRQLDAPGASSLIQPSQGVHIVLHRSFLPGDAAIMVPRTDDGRVLFAIPWHDRVIVGTTDTPVDEPTLEPVPFDAEIDFLLEHAARYLTKDPRRSDVLSAFAGLRPLVRSDADEDTSKISREHVIRVSASGLITIAGGKWTTYRKMAEDVVDVAQTLGELELRSCVTESLPIHGSCIDSKALEGLEAYGSDAPRIEALTAERPQLAEPFDSRLPIRGAEVVWAVQFEMARTVEDVLARRTRALLFDARAAIDVTPAVAKLMAEELGRDPGWVAAEVAAFTEVARGYILD